MKFPDLPEKFMESELELNEELQTLHVIATTPEFYPILMEVYTPYMYHVRFSSASVPMMWLYNHSCEIHVDVQCMCGKL